MQLPPYECLIIRLYSEIYFIKILLSLSLVMSTTRSFMMISKETIKNICFGFYIIFIASHVFVCSTHWNTTAIYTRIREFLIITWLRFYGLHEQITVYLNQTSINWMEWSDMTGSAVAFYEVVELIVYTCKRLQELGDFASFRSFFFKTKVLSCSH